MTPVYSRSDLLEVIHPAEVIRAVEEGFVAYSRGEVVVPPVGHLKFEHPPGDAHIKYGYIRGVLGGHPKPAIGGHLKTGQRNS
jgi:ornithine cyclodeaminase